MKEKSFLQIEAYNYIKNCILSGELQPDTLYSETKMAAKIGISRTPMREALQCLNQDGYITIVPSKGFKLRQLNEKDMNETIQVRCAIEGYCTYCIALEINTPKGQKLLQELDNMLQIMQQNVQSDMEAFIEADHTFHLLLINYMENPEFDQIFQRLMYLIHLTSKTSLSVQGRAQTTLLEHQKYYAALKAGDAATAYNLMIEHLTVPLTQVSHNTL